MYRNVYKAWLEGPQNQRWFREHDLSYERLVNCDSLVSDVATSVLHFAAEKGGRLWRNQKQTEREITSLASTSSETPSDLERSGLDHSEKEVQEAEQSFEGLNLLSHRWRGKKFQGQHLGLMVSELFQQNSLALKVMLAASFTPCILFGQARQSNEYLGIVCPLVNSMLET